VIIISVRQTEQACIDMYYFCVALLFNYIFFYYSYDKCVFICFSVVMVILCRMIPDTFPFSWPWSSHFRFRGLKSTISVFMDLK